MFYQISNFFQPVVDFLKIKTCLFFHTPYMAYKVSKAFYDHKSFTKHILVFFFYTSFLIKYNDNFILKNKLVLLNNVY